jgi:hypothetical protein
VLPAPRSATSLTLIKTTAQPRTDEIEGHEVCLPAHAPEHPADAAQDAIWELVQRRNGADCRHHAHNLHIIHEKVACGRTSTLSGRQRQWTCSRDQHAPAQHQRGWRGLGSASGEITDHSTFAGMHGA